ncbi:MAG TPA: hypothetical protein VI731_00560 [Bacteroidia bacterium]|nr:hypothetical protein [Bacteroidia bacterium]
MFFAWLNERTLDADKHIAKYTGLEGILSSDAGGYYAYLPALFIYNFNEPDTSLVMDRTGFRYENGKLVSKYPLGLAIGQSPFFMVAHLFANKKDGYSRPYHIAIRLSGVFYSSFGLLFCFLLFRKHTSWWLSLLACSVLFFGTNLSYYTLREPGYSHVFSFFLIALFFYLLDCFHEGGKLKKFLLLPVFAWIVAVRPIDAIILLPAIFWFGSSKNDLQKNLKVITTNKMLFPISALISLLFFVPQLLYNHFILGQTAAPIYPGEGFTNWYLPKFDVVLWGTNSGLFLYTPLFILFALVSIYAGIKNFPHNRILLVFFLLAVYIYAAWHAPGLGCSFSHRGQVDFLILWIFPFAIVMHNLVERRKWLSFSGIALLSLAFCLYTNYLAKYWWFCGYGNGDDDYAWFVREVKSYLDKDF